MILFDKELLESYEKQATLLLDKLSEIEDLKNVRFGNKTVYKYFCQVSLHFDCPDHWTGRTKVLVTLGEHPFVDIKGYRGRFREKFEEIIHNLNWETI